MTQTSPSDLGPDLALEARERDLAAALGAGERVDEGFTAFHQAVEEGALAHVRAADYGDDVAHQ